MNTTPEVIDYLKIAALVYPIGVVILLPILDPVAALIYGPVVSVVAITFYAISIGDTDGL